MNLGPAEILVVMVVALLAVGPTRLPAIARKLGNGMQELRRFQATLRDGVSDAFDPSPSAEPADTNVELEARQR